MGTRRLGAKVMTGVLAASLAAGLGVPDAARAQFAAADRVATTTTASAKDLAPEGKATGGGAADFDTPRVMALGDSITLGTGAPTRSSYRIDLAERLQRGGMRIDYVGSESSGADSDNEHEGHGGWGIGELSEWIEGWLAATSPDIVLVHAGTNNITRGDGAYATADKLSAMIDQIRAVRPEAYIFVAQIISSRVPRELAEDRIYNQLIPGLVAAKNDPLISVVDQSTVGGIDLHDLHHPNQFGYSKMAYNWYQAMAKVFHMKGNIGTNPYAMQSTHRCLAAKVVLNGRVQHRTECRTWQLRTVTAEIDGVHRRVRTWQTLRTVKRAYRVRVAGKLRIRTRLVGKWTGPGNLMNL